MALIKEITLPNTAIATYWRLAPLIEFNVDSGRAEGTILGYASGQARDDGATPFITKKYTVVIPDLNGNVRAQIYTLLPTTILGFEATPYLEGAVTDE